MELNYESMMESGVHFGHQTKRWNPKFGPYLYKQVHGISIINLERTRECLEKAAAFLTEQVKNGAKILLVGTKPQAQELVRELAEAVDMPFCSNRWLGGCLTNFETVKTSLAKYQRFLDMEESGELSKLPKKESSAIRREMVRMHRSFEGIRHLEKRPDILFVVDATHESIALREARRLQIPTMGVVDTNSDPTVLDYPIPANDDSVKSLRVIFEVLQEAIAQGIELHKLNKAAHKDIPSEVSEVAKKTWSRKRVNNETKEEKEKPAAEKKAKTTKATTAKKTTTKAKPKTTKSTEKKEDAKPVAEDK